VKTTVEIKGKSIVETRYFLTSLTNIDDFARAVRAHWGIENHLHWHLDVSFGEDSSRIRNKNAAGMWNVLRKLALEHLKQQAFGGMSLKSLRKLAGWDSNFLERVLFA
jgi:predicted transposase YbfD/YdcC